MLGQRLEENKEASDVEAPIAPKDEIITCIKNSEENKHKNKSNEFYSNSEDYWSKQPPTVNGMLGGYDFISQDDIFQSQQFLDYFMNVCLIF